MEPSLQIKIPDEQLEIRYSQVFQEGALVPPGVQFIPNTSTVSSIIWMIFSFFFAGTMALMVFAAILTLLKGNQMMTRVIMGLVMLGAGFGFYKLTSAGLRQLQAYRRYKAGTYQEGFYLFKDAFLMHVKGKNTLLPKRNIQKIELVTKIGSDARGRTHPRSFPVIHYQDEKYAGRKLTLEGSYSVSGTEFTKTLKQWFGEN